MSTQIIFPNQTHCETTSQNKKLSVAGSSTPKTPLHIASQPPDPQPRKAQF